MLTAPSTRSPLVCERRRIDDPGDLLDCVPDGSEASAYFAHPTAGLALATSGVAAEIRTRGPERFARAAEAARALFDGMEPRGDGPGPLLVGGFGFADDDPADPRWQGFPALHFIVPECVWLRRGGETWLVRVRAVGKRGGIHVAAADSVRGESADMPRGEPVAAPRAPEARPPTREAWIATVRDALAAIAAGRLRKIVLARTQQRSIESDPTATARATVRRLRDERDECLSFWLQHRRASFVGSSPEIMARVREGTIEATALAGSAPRARRADEDAASARRLRACLKNRGEHAFVADDVRRALASICERVSEREMEVRRYPEAFHLATPFRGVLRAGTGLLDAACALHPTSAVCGAPRDAARAMIAVVEAERGWYAGGVGWMDAAGEGTLAVALRCGLLRSASATLWAGAGIVADSDPLIEYDETETKLQAMRRALAGDYDDERAA